MRRLACALAPIVVAVAALTLIAEEPTRRSTLSAAPDPPAARHSMPVEDGPVAAQPYRLPDGRMTISGPTKIDRPGSYVVTRSIFASGPILTIRASAILATIDLNGFAIWRTDSAGPVVDTVPDGDARPNVTIRNGEIAGGSTGIDGGDGVYLTNVGFFDQAGDGVDLSTASSVYILHCTIANSGGRGIVFAPTNSSSIIGTVVRETEDTGIDITGTGTVVVRDCSVEGAKGVGISVVGDGNHISENVIRGVQETPPSSGNGHGVYVDGARNLIEGCLIEGNTGAGIHFGTGTSDNAYRNNMLLGNAIAVGGPINRDEGRNIQ